MANIWRSEVNSFDSLPTKFVSDSSQETMMLIRAQNFSIVTSMVRLIDRKENFMQINSIRISSLEKDSRIILSDLRVTHLFRNIEEVGDLLVHFPEGRRGHKNALAMVGE